MKVSTAKLLYKLPHWRKRSFRILAGAYDVTWHSKTWSQDVFTCVDMFFFENNLANLWTYAGYVFPKCQHVLSIPTPKNDCPFFIAQSERRLTKNSSERMPLRPPGNSMAILTAIPMLMTGLGESTQPQTCSSTTHAGRTPNCGREENRLVKLFHLVSTSRFIHIYIYTHTQCTDMCSMYSIAILITFSQL